MNIWGKKNSIGSKSESDLREQQGKEQGECKKCSGKTRAPGTEKLEGSGEKEEKKCVE